jgi:hypothetical protein
MEQNYSKRISKTLKFSEIYNSAGTYVGGGISNSKGHVNDEIWVEIMEDPVLDPQTENLINTGRLQIHIGSTRRALNELGTFLLALANYSPPRGGYTSHIEWSNRDGEPQLHVILHLPIDESEERPKFDQSINVATGVISYDGEQVMDTTILPKKEEHHNHETDER